MTVRDLSPSDGRTARRTENKEAALRCAIALFGANKLVPSIEDVARESGISIRSLYRYFGDSQTMLRDSVEVVVSEIRPLAIVANIGEGPLADRVDELVSALFRAYRHAAPVLRATIVNIANIPELIATHQRSRALLSLQFTHHFAPEFGLLSDAEAAQVLQAGIAITNLEFIDMVTTRQGLSYDAAQEMIIGMLLRILTP